MMNLNQDTNPFRDKCLIKKKWGGNGKVPESEEDIY